MPLNLFDTYARRERPFTSIETDKVRLYACGPTVYNYQHIGNYRTYIFEDILRRAVSYTHLTLPTILRV